MNRALPEPLLLDSKAAAQTLGISLSLFYALDSEGKLPQGFKLHSKKMFCYEHLKLYAANGLPRRDSAEWAALLAGTK